MLGSSAQARPGSDTSAASVVADLDGDGRPDHVSLDVVGDRVVLKMSIAGRKQAQAESFAKRDFGCSPVTWKETCPGERGAMRAVAVDAGFRKDFALMFDLEAAHLSSRKGAHVVVIPLAGTDPFWVYWDPTINGVAWTRL